MSAAKGKKRAKGKTLTLSDFLHDDKEAAPGFAYHHVDWAEAMENEEIDDKYTLDCKKVVLPTAPKAARGLDIDMNLVPSKPPYTAYVGNLPYDATEDDIDKFFRKLKLDVTSVRIPREGGERGRVRGFGYAEFPDRKSLIEALTLNNESLKNRAIKVSLATEHGNEGGERKEERSDRTAGDWRSSPREDSFGGGRVDSEPYRGRSNNDFGPSRDSDRGGERDFDRKFSDRGFGGERDRGFGGDRDRGFGGDRDRGFGGDRDRGFGGGGFGGDRDRGFGGDRDRGGFERRDQGRDFGSSRYDDYPKRGADDFPRRGGDDFPRRGGEDFQRGGGSEEFSRDRGGYERRNDRPDYSRDGPKERPKLQLKPRSAAPVDTSKDGSASSKIFGAAKPVDTAAREREIEEKLAKEKGEPRIIGERRDDDRMRRTVLVTSPVRSRQTSESSNKNRNSLSEDDTTPPSKPPTSRQRHSSSGSDPNVRENEQLSKSNDHKDDQSRSNGSIQVRPDLGSNQGGKDRRALHSSHIMKEPPIISANKFSHLIADNDDEDVDGHASD